NRVSWYFKFKPRNTRNTRTFVNSAYFAYFAVYSTISRNLLFKIRSSYLFRAGVIRADLHPDAFEIVTLRIELGDFGRTAVREDREPLGAEFPADPDLFDGALRRHLVSADAAPDRFPAGIAHHSDQLFAEESRARGISHRAEHIQPAAAQPQFPILE